MVCRVGFGCMGEYGGDIEVVGVVDKDVGELVWGKEGGVLGIIGLGIYMEEVRVKIVGKGFCGRMVVGGFFRGDDGLCGRVEVVLWLLWGLRVVGKDVKGLKMEGGVVGVRVYEVLGVVRVEVGLKIG